MLQVLVNATLYLFFYTSIFVIIYIYKRYIYNSGEMWQLPALFLACQTHVARRVSNRGNQARPSVNRSRDDQNIFQIVRVKSEVLMIPLQVHKMCLRAGICD